jgi:glycosyltransferase involved in cell wall biosynthesis
MIGSPAVLLINSMGTGGAERAVAKVARGLRAAGRDIRVLCLEREAPGESAFPGQEIVRLSGLRASSSSVLKLIMLPLLARRLAAYVRRERATVVMSHLFRANFVNVLSRLLARASHRVILVNHTRVSRLSSEGFQGRMNWSFCRWLYPRADFVASVSAGAAEECARLLSLQSEKSITLHDPVDISAAASAAATAKPVHAIVAVGRLVRLKRFSDLIDSFASVAGEFPRLELRIIGDGPERSNLERQAGATEVGDRIHFLGRLADPLPDLAGCEVFVSASETEGFGMAIVEALAAGIPVIASDCAFGPREILAPSTDPARRLEGDAPAELTAYGILFAVGSAVALTAALRRILADASLRASLAQRGPRRASDFSVEKSTAEYDKLLLVE